MPARYSPVAPIALLENLFKHEILCDEDILGNYLLLLTHDVLEYPDRYAHLIHQIRAVYADENDTFIIMDNSVVELGEAMDVGSVIRAAQIVDADCIMTPDVLGDMEATKKIVAEEGRALLTSGFPLMRVPQGNDMNELFECARFLHRFFPAGRGSPEYWGIPRWISNELGSRIPIVQHIGMNSPFARIHMLGTSKHHEDDCRCCWIPNVMGIDSANPLVLGYAGFDIEKHGWKHMKRGNYWELSRLENEVLANMSYMRREIQS